MNSTKLIDIAVNFGANGLVSKIPEIVDQALKSDISSMIALGCSVESSQHALSIAQQFPGIVYSTAGIHPHDAKTFEHSTLSILTDLAQKPEVVALGECGLDFNRDFSPRDKQIEVFEEQLQLACELKMPVVMHQRDAHDEFMKILTKYRSKLKQVVVHCFTGTQIELETYIDLDCHIGITGWICDERRGLHLLESVKSIPNNRLMLETDSPYLMPRNMNPKPKSRNNRPSNLFHIANTVAVARCQTIEELRKNCFDTTTAFFELAVRKELAC